MTGSEWNQVDVTGPDLFGGVLFGDELMEMYNSEAVVGDETHVVESHEINALLASGTPSNKAGTDSDPHESGSAFDDGFGAFRPSTSFNDLTTLLAEPVESNPSATTGAVAGTTAPETTAAPPKKSRKRSSEAGTKAEAATKKRAGGQRGKASSATSARAGGKTKPSGTKAGQSRTAAQSAGHAALKLRKEQQSMIGRNSKASNNTPNPLINGASVPAAKSTSARPSATPAVARSAPVVPLPTKVMGGGKGDSITSEAAAATAAAVAASVSLPSLNKTGAATESDFRSVAQAAVTNLILNAGNNPKADNVTSAASKSSSSDSDNFNIKVDTSTAHIKALTSSNWVNACSSTTECPTTASSGDKSNNRARRQNLTPDERARQNRDRNREHARNTRLRKKAYVEELKRTLTELVSQRDAADLEKRHAAQREMEQREVRFRVMEEFLKLRGRNEPNFARWIAILEDEFELTLPLTPYRKTVNDETGDQHVLQGAGDVMADAACVSAFLQTLGNAPGQNGSVTLLHSCERKKFFMDGCTAVMQWTATSQGAASEISVKGMMRAKFCAASNKLISAEMMFDTGSVATQVSSETPDAAAQAAAHQADALLDSLQMPHLSATVPSAITVGSHPNSTAVSVSASDKGDLSSDESTEEVLGKPETRQSGVVSE